MDGGRTDRASLPFFADGVAKVADIFTKREVLAVVIDEHTGFFELKFSGFLIYIAGVSTDIEDVGYKHIVTSEVSDTLYSTFNA